MLSLAKTPATATVVQGGTGTFTLALTNSATAGPTTQTVTVTDNVPANLTVTSLTASTGGWTCTGTQTVSCTVPAGFAAGATDSIVVNYTVDVGSGRRTQTR